MLPFGVMDMLFLEVALLTVILSRGGKGIYQLRLQRGPGTDNVMDDVWHTL